MEAKSMVGQISLGFVVACLYVISFIASAAEPDATAPPTADGGLPVEWQDKSLLAKSADVRLRERPDENAACVEFSVQGVWLHPRRLQGDWLQVETGWVRTTDVVLEEQALDYFTAELMKSKCAFAYVGRARAWMKKKDYDRAQRDLSEALRLDPRCARAYLARALLAEEQHDPDEMLANCDRALQTDPRDAVALELRGAAWLGRREFDRALADFDAAVAACPNNCTARLRRSQVLGIKSEYQKAAEDAEEVLRLDPRNADAHAIRAEIH
jgi:tetratricopeptide (TPR) repeat protein